jgi:hypothetical protein
VPRIHIQFAPPRLIRFRGRSPSPIFKPIPNSLLRLLIFLELSGRNMAIDSAQFLSSPMRASISGGIFPVSFLVTTQRRHGQAIPLGCARHNLGDERERKKQPRLQTNSTHQTDFNFSKTRSMTSSLFKLAVSPWMNPLQSGKRLWASLRTDEVQHALICANQIRHDSSSGSVLVDGYVIPLTEPRCHELPLYLRDFTDGHVPITTVPAEEARLWKHLLPAVVERCRHSWVH